MGKKRYCLAFLQSFKISLPAKNCIKTNLYLKHTLGQYKDCSAFFLNYNPCLLIDITEHIVMWSEYYDTFMNNFTCKQKYLRGEFLFSSYLLQEFSLRNTVRLFWQMQGSGFRFIICKCIPILGILTDEEKTMIHLDDKYQNLHWWCTPTSKSILNI